MERVTRAPVIAAALLALALAAYLVWKRRASTTGKSDDPRRTPRDTKVEAATALYRSLEQALNTQGIARPTALPPLRHAEDLVAKAHPLADDVMELTTRYIESRFGGVVLSDDVQRDFARRVKEIGAHREPPPPSRSS
jgi:hypothetical protein